jgi:DNA (cytosine-5)-methyltransferase 1
VEFRGKPAADGPRYRALGNSMAVPVMRWIGERIAMVDGLLQKRTPAELAGAVEKEVG